MDVRYDPHGGLVVTLPVYEGEMSLKLMRLIVKEVEKLEGDVSPFVEVMSSILTNRIRVQ